MNSCKEKDPVKYYATYYWLTKLGKPVADIYNSLLQYFDSLESAWESSRRPLRSCKFESDVLNERFYNNSLKDEALRVCDDAYKKKIQLVCPEDDSYPTLLKKSSTKPFLLFCRGQISEFNKRTYQVLRTFRSPRQKRCRRHMQSACRL